MIEHVPVLIGEILDIYRAYPSRGHVLDCTLGLGGYAEAILSSSDARLIGIDQDEQALAFSRDRLRRFGDRFDGVKANFRSLPEEVTSRAPFGAFFFDLGVSNLQLTDDARGFSFQSDGPLDMRMDLASNRSAADIVNSGTEGEIADIFWKYGEERHSRRLARAIVRHREAVGPIMRTETLVAVISTPANPPERRRASGARVFQALQFRQRGALRPAGGASSYSVTCGARGVAVRSQLPFPGGPHRQDRFSSVEGAGQGRDTIQKADKTLFRRGGVKP